MKLLLIALLVLVPLTPIGAMPLNLALPTDNRALIDGKPEDYYMYVHRNFGGVASKPWTAGMYGFVRNLKKTKTDGVIATRFHEGLDIKPIKRDRSNNPLDEIRSIADGTVAYVNSNRAGSYGRYLVVEHNWGDGPFFSLYAHLSQINCEIGQQVLAGTPLAIMGFTGRGINRERAHLHLELCLMATDQFDAWHEKFFGGKSPRGLYNGLNFIGIDIASLFLAERQNPQISIPEFLATANPYFKVAVPRHSDRLRLAQRYPWLQKGDPTKPSHSWEISYTDSGIPISVTPSARKVTQPTITFVRTTRSDHKYYTRGRLEGTGRKASLTKSGKRFVALFSDELVKAPTPSQAQ